MMCFGGGGGGAPIQAAPAPTTDANYLQMRRDQLNRSDNAPNPRQGDTEPLAIDSTSATDRLGRSKVT
jgi:hypothetical protein